MWIAHLHILSIPPHCFRTQIVTYHHTCNEFLHCPQLNPSYHQINWPLWWQQQIPHSPYIWFGSTNFLFFHMSTYYNMVSMFSINKAITFDSFLVLFFMFFEFRITSYVTKFFSFVLGLALSSIPKIFFNKLGTSNVFFSLFRMILQSISFLNLNLNYVLLRISLFFYVSKWFCNSSHIEAISQLRL